MKNAEKNVIVNTIWCRVLKVSSMLILFSYQTKFTRARRKLKAKLIIELLWFYKHYNELFYDYD